MCATKQRKGAEGMVLLMYFLHAQNVSSVIAEHTVPYLDYGGHLSHAAQAAFTPHCATALGQAK